MDDIRVLINQIIKGSSKAGIEVSDVLASYYVLMCLNLVASYPVGTFDLTSLDLTCLVLT
jgi:hypothetical protein